MNHRIHFDIFNHRRPDFENLLPYGFFKSGSQFIYIKDIINRHFQVHIFINSDGTVKSKVINTLSNDE